MTGQGALVVYPLPTSQPLSWRAAAGRVRRAGRWPYPAQAAGISGVGCPAPARRGCLGRLTPCRKPHLRTPRLPLKVELTTVRSGQPGAPALKPRPSAPPQVGISPDSGAGPRQESMGVVCCSVARTLCSRVPEPLRQGEPAWPQGPRQLPDRRDCVGVLPPPLATASAWRGAAPRPQAGRKRTPPGSTQLPLPPVARGPADTLRS